jgi:hypothetical protein
MCELLIRVRDKAFGDLYQKVKQLGRGDVVSVVENGWGWSQEELTNPDWRILKLPNILVDDVTDLLAPEDNPTPLIPNRMLQRHGKKLDLSHVNLAPLVPWFQDDTRAQTTRTVNITRAQARALVAVKPPVADPNTLG